MRIIFIVIGVLLAGALFFFLTRCVEGVDTKKTGLSYNSSTLEEAKENKVFQYQVYPSQTKFTLPNGKIISIKQAWVENGWSYEKKCWCKVGIKKKDYSNLVIETANYSPNDYDSFLLGNNRQQYFSLRSSVNSPDATLSTTVDTSEHYLKFFWYRNKNEEFDTLVFKN